jgi:hypothetical protein
VKDTLVSSSAHCVSLLNKDLLDFPSTGRLLVGFPDVLPSTTQGLLAAILLNQPVKLTKLSCFISIKTGNTTGSVGER